MLHLKWYPLRRSKTLSDWDMFNLRLYPIQQKTKILKRPKMGNVWLQKRTASHTHMPKKMYYKFLFYFIFWEVNVLLVRLEKITGVGLRLTRVFFYIFIFYPKKKTKRFFFFFFGLHSYNLYGHFYSNWWQRHIEAEGGYGPPKFLKKIE